MKTWRGRSTSSFLFTGRGSVLPPQLHAASAKDLEGIKKRIAREQQESAKQKERARFSGTGQDRQGLGKKTKDLNAASSKVAASGLK